MKSKLLTASLFALALAGCDKQPSPPASPAQPTAAEKAKDAVVKAGAKVAETAGDMKDAVGQKITEWKLTPDDIKADLAKAGRIVRQKGVAAGAKVGEVFDNARIVTMVNAKLVADHDLSAFKINVDADKGTVTLKGTVTSHSLIGRVILLALETEGVTGIVSELTVSP